MLKKLYHIFGRKEKWQFFGLGVMILIGGLFETLGVSMMVPVKSAVTDPASVREKIAETETSVAYKDFAHSPSKLKATVNAVRERYPEKKLVAAMELHTFSSLMADFLPQYKGCMAEADVEMTTSPS